MQVGCHLLEDRVAGVWRGVVHAVSWNKYGTGSKVANHLDRAHHALMIEYVTDEGPGALASYWHKLLA